MTKIRISPGHRSITWDPSRSLMDQLLENGIYLDNACSGRGLCGKCRIRVVSGEGTPVTGEEEKLLSREELDSGIRLACMMEPVTDLELETVGGEKKGKVLTGGYIPEFQRAPLTRMMPLTVERQTVEQQTPFEDVLMEKTGAVRVDANALMGGSRAPGEYTAVIREGCVVDIVPGHQTKYYGAAVDIGTTTVVCSLVDMETGEILADASEINAQKTFGLDVLSRITYEMEHPEEGAGKLQRAIVESMNAMIGEVCRETGVRRESIREITVAANCTMLHLLLGIDARPVGTAPFAPVFTGSRNLLASDIGLKAGERAALYCLPSVSAYIGADIVAGAYVCDLQHRKGNVLFIDIGTNGEIVLASGGRLLSCSCAAGPALEGMNISCGMRAADGAIEDVVITADGEVERKVIGDEAPCGICGSGILTVTRELIRTGIVRKTGAFAKADAFDEEDPRRKLIEVGGRREAVIPPAGRGTVPQDHPGRCASGSAGERGDSLRIHGPAEPGRHRHGGSGRGADRRTVRRPPAGGQPDRCGNPAEGGGRPDALCGEFLPYRRLYGSAVRSLPAGYGRAGPSYGICGAGSHGGL